IQAIAFDPDGGQIGSASLDGAVRVWDTRTGQSRLSLNRKEGDVHHVSFLPDGKTLDVGIGTCDQWGYWNVITGREVDWRGNEKRCPLKEPRSPRLGPPPAQAARLVLGSGRRFAPADRRRLLVASPGAPGEAASGSSDGGDPVRHMMRLLRRH